LKKNHKQQFPRSEEYRPPKSVGGGGGGGGGGGKRGKKQQIPNFLKRLQKKLNSNLTTNRKVGLARKRKKGLNTRKKIRDDKEGSYQKRKDKRRRKRIEISGRAAITTSDATN